MQAKTNAPRVPSVPRAKTEDSAYTTRRVYLVSLFLLVLAGAAVVGLSIPLAFPSEELWVAFVLTAVMAAQQIWRIDTRLAFRTSVETMILMTTTFSLFFLSTGWFVVANGVGMFVGLWRAKDFTTRAAAVSAALHFLAVVMVAAATTPLGFRGPTDALRSILAVSLLWLAVSLVKLPGPLLMNFALRQKLDLRAAWTSSGRGASRRLIPVVIGYLLAVAIVSSPWMVVGVLFATVWMYYVYFSLQRSAALEREIAWLAEFGREAGRCTTIEEVEVALAEAYDPFVFSTHAVAYPKECDPTLGPSAREGVRWRGLIADYIESRYQHLDQLAELCAHSPSPIPTFDRYVWVWEVDAERRSYLVLTGHHSTSAARQIATSGSHLVGIAQLAIATIRRREDLRSEADLAHQRGRVDPTTGLPNALALAERLGEVEASLSGRPVGVISTALVAFDHTVSVLGWQVGQERLLEFARQLEALLASRSGRVTIGRVDDYALGVIADADANETLRLGLEIADYESERALRGGANASWSMMREVYVGVAKSVADRHQSPENLFRHAKLALSRSQVSGHVEVVGEDELERESRQMTIRMRIPSAIENGHIVPAIQPQYDLETGSLVGGEVLARWNDPVLGYVSPAEFVRIAEQSQQIELLTISLFEQVSSEPSLGGGRLMVPLAFNLSARSLSNSAFLAALVDIADRNKLSVADIRFEVAEASIAEDPQKANEGLALLRSLGARVAIDEFGTGKSTLALLDKLDVDEVKVSGELVTRIGTVESPNPMVKNLLLLCDDLNLAVVASGIEEPAGRDVLRGLGCRTGQGYLFAPAVSLEEFAAMLRDGHQTNALRR